MVDILGVSGGDDVGAGRELDTVQQPGHVRLRVGRADCLQGDRLALHHALSLQGSRELGLAKIGLSCK